VSSNDRKLDCGVKRGATSSLFTSSLLFVVTRSRAPVAVLLTCL
jgi:hypothetical protein